MTTSKNNCNNTSIVRVLTIGDCTQLHSSSGVLFVERVEVEVFAYLVASSQFSPCLLH